MNTNLKKLAKKGNKKQLLVNVLMIIVLVIGVFGLIGSLSGDGEALPYTAERAEGERAYVDAQYASEDFAYFETDESDKLYFVMDKDFRAYIVCVSDAEIGSYADLQAFTFGEITKQPNTVRTEGKLVVIDDELMQLAINEFNYFWGENVVDSKNAKEFFGAYYIDTAVTDMSGDYLVFAALIGIAIGVMIFMAKKNSKAKAKTKQVLANLTESGEAALVDAELQDIRTKEFKKIGVYLTERYLISYRNGLTVVPLSEMTGLYGVVTEKNYELVIRHADESEQVVVQTENKVNKQWDELVALVTAISVQKTELEYGSDRVKVEGAVEVTQVEHFFVARNTKSALEVQTELTNPDGTVIEPNVGLGVIGALVGAVIGGALWVLIGKLGYIAGIAGFAIIYLSAMGYKKGAKVLTRSGAVIAVILSVLMIFAANYFLYVWMIVEAFEGRYTFGEVLPNLFSMLSEYELVGSFVKDVVIGYGLSVLAAFSTLKTLLGKKK